MALGALHPRGGGLHLQLRRHDKAERLLRAALELRRSLHGGDHADVAESLEELGTALRGRADYAAAAGLLEEATAMRRRLDGGGASGSASAGEGPARSLFLLGTVQRMRGDLAAAQRSLDEALRLSGRRRSSPAAARGGLLPADVLDELGAVARGKGDYARAESCLREALALRRREQGAKKRYRNREAAGLATMVLAFDTARHSGDKAEARRAYRALVRRARFLVDEQREQQQAVTATAATGRA